MDTITTGGPFPAERGDTITVSGRNATVYEYVVSDVDGSSADVISRLDMLRSVNYIRFRQVRRWSTDTLLRSLFR